MKSAWQKALDCIAKHEVFNTEPLMRECPYCREMFKPCIYRPTLYYPRGSLQRFCSKTCLKLYKLDIKERKL